MAVTSLLMFFDGISVPAFAGFKAAKNSRGSSLQRHTLKLNLKSNQIRIHRKLKELLGEGLCACAWGKR